MLTQIRSRRSRRDLVRLRFGPATCLQPPFPPSERIPPSAGMSPSWRRFMVIPSVTLIDGWRIRIRRRLRPSLTRKMTSLDPFYNNVPFAISKLLAMEVTGLSCLSLFISFLPISSYTSPSLSPPSFLPRFYTFLHSLPFPSSTYPFSFSIFNSLSFSFTYASPSCPPLMMISISSFLSRQGTRSG